MTNVYSTESEPVTFINSMNMLRSTVTFPYVESRSSLKTNLTSVPFIKHDIIKDAEKFSYFISSLDAQYTAIEEVLDKLQNNMCGLGVQVVDPRTAEISDGINVIKYRVFKPIHTE